jgi:hypothetical protein
VVGDSPCCLFAADPLDLKTSGIKDGRKEISNYQQWDIQARRLSLPYKKHFNKYFTDLLTSA